MQDQITLPPLPVQDAVEFKHVPGWAGYCVGDNGTVWSCRRTFALEKGRGSSPGLGLFWKKIKPGSGGPQKRPVFTMMPKRRMFYVHRIILESFIGPCPLGMEACHGDGDVNNNRLSNLRWDTRSSNARDKVRHGTHNRGERHNLAKLTAESVRQIRIKYAAGKSTQQDIADEYGVSVASISLLINRKTWRYLI
jgi:hypothetical protein